MNKKLNRSSATAPSPLEKGLRSLRGIHWLLAAGGLVSAVSVYRLVESQWGGMSVAGQFLTLVVGALAVFASGDILRNRLRLLQAGSALGYLFTALVPVLAWGAGYLNLLGEPVGWLTLATSMAVLLVASGRVFRQTLRYEGVFYPATFAGLTLSLPLLPQVRAALGFSDEVFYLGAAVALGTSFYAGSLHINRFLFHRDRRDGKDRPIHFLPFLVLAVLFIAGMVLLDPRSTFIALPLTIVGTVLVRTGEEYYRALARSLRAKPASWPKRSAALLTIGFSMVLIAWPIACLDVNLRCLALVSSMTAWLCLTWGLRYGSVRSHIPGVIAALFAYHFIPAFFPELANRISAGFAEITGIAADSPVLTSFAHLGFLVGLFLFGWLLRRRRVPEQMESMHALLTVLHGSALVAAAVVDFHGAVIFFPAALGIIFAGTLLARRIELLLLGHTAAAAAVLVGIAEFTGVDSLVTSETVHALGLFTLAMIILSVVFEDGLARILRTPIVTTREVLIIPTSLTAFLIGLHGLNYAGWSEIILAGAVFLTAGQRLSNSFLLTAGIAALSAGVHGLAMEHFGYPSASFTLTTFLFFVVSWILARLSCGKGGDSMRPWSAGTILSMFFHGMVGALSLLSASGDGTVTIEPLILPLVGLALIDWGFLKRNSDWVTLGIGLSVVYAPLHLWTKGWIETVPMAWVAASPVLLLSLLASRWSDNGFARRPAEQVLTVWTATGFIVCLVFSGVAGLTLALTLLAVGLIARDRSQVTIGSSYLALVQLTFVLNGVREGVLLADFAALGLSLLPIGATFTLVWLLFLHRTGQVAKMAPEMRAAVELIIAFGYFMAFTGSASFSALENAGLVAVAIGFASYQAYRSWQEQAPLAAWMMQAWTALAVLHGFTAGWLSLESGIAPYALLTAGTLEYGLSGLANRHTRGRVLAVPADTVSRILPLVAGSLAFFRVFADGHETTLWYKVLPLFLTSLFYLVVASRETSRALPSVFASGFLGLGLLAIAWAQGMGTELYCLAPGLSLLALSYLLRDEMGPTWSRHTFAAGAAFVYATPVLALYDELSWAWQAVLLVMTVVFGAASFVLRSRSLLTVSTAAMLIDLACFVIMIRETEPILLWVGGLGLGIGLIAIAAYLEYQREGLAQQIRVFGQELQAWY